MLVCKTKKEPMPAPIPWDDLALFLQLYRARSVSQAAERLGLTQALVSRRLSSLEQTAGALLFVRGMKDLHPTALAKEWAPLAESIEAKVTEAARLAVTVGRAPSGVVQLALPESLAEYVLAPTLAGLWQQHPAIRLELCVDAGVPERNRLEADLAVRFVCPDSDELVAGRLFAMDYGVFGAKHYLARNRDIALAEHDWVTWERSLGHLPESRWYAAHIGRPPRLMSNRATTIIAAIRSGLGIGLLPRQFARTLGLVEVTASAPPQALLEGWIVSHAEFRHLPRVDAVWRWLETLFVAPRT